MPKRRLGYGEVALEKGTSTPPRDRQDPPRADSLPVDGSQRSSRRRSSDILLQVSHYCQSHSDYHKSRKDTAHLCENENELPDRCRADIRSLRNLLPKVERKLQPGARDGKGPTAQDVVHLCDFYHSVLRSTFCPHASHILSLGKKLRDVLSRVHFILQHVVFGSIFDAIQQESVDETALEAKPASIASTLGTTIAQFLTFLADSYLYTGITMDLVNILEDCNTALQEEIIPVKMSLFLEAELASNEDCDLVLEVRSIDQALALQSVVLSALNAFLKSSHEKFQQGYADTMPGAKSGEMQYDCASLVEARYLIDHNWMAAVLKNLRNILLSTRINGAKFTLWCHVKMEAAQMLTQILLGFVASPPSGEVASTAARTVVEAARLAVSSELSLPASYTKMLVSLMRVAFSDMRTFGRLLGVGSSPILTCLVDCIQLIDSKGIRQRGCLDRQILTTINVFLHKLSPTSSLRASIVAHILMGRTLRSLLNLLADRDLVNHCSRVLATVIVEGALSLDLNLLCDALKRDSTKVSDRSRSIETPASREDTSMENTSRAKRRRKASKEPRTPQSPIQPLQVSQINRGMPVSETDVPNSLTCLPALREALNSALRAAQDFADGRAHDLSEIDAARITGMLRLGSDVFVEHASRNKDPSELTSFFDILEKLWRCVKSLSQRLSEKNLDAFNKKDSEIAHILVDCVLNFHFLVRSFHASPPAAFAQTSDRVVTEIASLARRLIFSEYLYRIDALQVHQNSTRALHTKVPLRLGTLANTRSEEISTGTRCLFLAHNEDRNSPGLASTVAFDMMANLAFESKCFLLASLYPGRTTIDPDMDMEQVVETNELNFRSLLELVQRAKRTKLGIQEHLVETTLLVAPVLMSSLCRQLLESNHPNAYTSMLHAFVRDFAFPLLKEFDLDNEEICIAVLLSLLRVQSDRGSSWTSSTIARLMKSLMDIDPLVTPSAGKAMGLELNIKLRETTCLLASKIPEQHHSAIVRRLRWTFLVSSVTTWSLTEVREHGLRTQHDKSSTSGKESDKFRSKSWLLWLLESAFTDNDKGFRDAVSKRLYTLILGQRTSFLVAHYSGGADFRAKDPSEEVEESVVIELFRDIDRLLQSSVGISDSQLSFTMPHSDSDYRVATNTVRSQSFNRFSMQQSALRILATLCRESGLGSLRERFFLEKAYRRLSRVWAASNIEKSIDIIYPTLRSSSSSKAFAFSELSRINVECQHTLVSLRRLSPHFLPTIVGDIFTLRCDVSKLQQFTQLELFIRRMFLRNDEYAGLSSSKILALASHFYEENLPTVLAQFMVLQDIELLRLAVGFRDFLVERTMQGRRKADVAQRIGSSNMPNRNQIKVSRLEGADIDKRIKALCLEGDVIRDMLPLILMNSDRNGLGFFTTLVMAVQDIMKQREREMVVLKGLAWELGRDPAQVSRAKLAIQAAFAARVLDQSGDIDSIKTASQWVTSQFMFLLVNVVQGRWKTRPLNDRLQAVRCLDVLIDFLVASEAPQYFSQILATVNASITDGDSENWTSPQDVNDATNLRLFAVKALSKYLRLVLESQKEAIVPRLTAIVVTLIPLLEEGDQTISSPGGIYEARSIAVSILEFLVDGEIGRFLAPTFAEIPFLPSSPTLDSVRRLLQSNGVDFDNLVISSTGTQNYTGNEHKDDTVPDLSGPHSVKSNEGTGKLRALQKRLKLLSGLLENESTSVRKVTLQHLADLLRGNRQLFYRLVLIEGTLTRRQLLTIVYRDGSGKLKWTSQGAVTGLMEKLLARCVAETQPEVLLQLGTCIGEVGAICETKLGELRIGTSMGDKAIDSPTSSYKWRLERPPWNSQSEEYQLQLVTDYLVVAMNSASSSAEQNKIVFSIQQLLRLLNEYGRRTEKTKTETIQESMDKVMSTWLRTNLEKNGIYDVIEPYFQTDFKEKSSEGYVTKKPPFFRAAVSYFTWMSNLCRWMIQSAMNSDLSPWRHFFHACRTAVRTESGLNIAEFILPLLVLDRVCFGTSEHQVMIRQEFLDVLQVDLEIFMDFADRKRAANSVFMTIDTLRAWSERGIEERYKARSSTSNRGRRQPQTKKDFASTQGQKWSEEDSIEKIQDLLSNIPFALQAGAAARMGMQARALFCLEMIARKEVVVEIFEKSSIEQKKDFAAGNGQRLFGTKTFSLSQSIDRELLKNVLSRLDDYETIAAVGKETQLFSPLQQMKNSILEKEAVGNFHAALDDYESILQARALTGPTNDITTFQNGALRCLLELGRYQTVLKQVEGLTRRDGLSSTKSSESFSCAVEAAWKLGQWETLSDLLDADKHVGYKQTGQTDDMFQVWMGRAMLGLHRNETASVKSAIMHARENVMDSLSGVAAENYARSYFDIVRLHSLREVENMNEMSCNEAGAFKIAEIAKGTSIDGWAWEERTGMASCRGALQIFATRVAMARLHADPLLEGSLFLSSGQRARKQMSHAIAENMLYQAQAAVANLSQQDLLQNSELNALVFSSQHQLAKVKYSAGDTAVSLKILGHDGVQSIVDKMLPHLESREKICELATRYEQTLLCELGGVPLPHGGEDFDLTKRFALRLLQLTRWTSQMGLMGGSETVASFRLIQKLAPEWEKGHFHFGKYVDALLQARMNVLTAKGQREPLNAEDKIREEVLFRDKTCQKHILLAMETYAAALKIDTKHVYQVLPRMLSLWFDLVSVDSLKDASKKELSDSLSKNQSQANEFMASQIREIPAIAFYTAVQQLISRVIHRNKETSMVVKKILQRVLLKFPLQAMWMLAWLKGSRDTDRAKIGEEIFTGAEKALSKNHRAMAKALSVSQNLFRFLRELAIYQGSQERQSSVLQIRPWHSDEVPLSEFVPPIQAALSITPLSTDYGNARDHFSRDIPRMRAFSSRIGVMSSKAKPKKLKAYAVSGNYKQNLVASSPKNKAKPRQHPDDIGELHFLVKQEAKGDLRKDARVQDLNNVINRLMASNNDVGVASRRRRRLHLRTFAVTCLSEDVGILEWVPDTDSLRNLVSKSYNPQTSSGCPRRRGHRLANFGDATLRSHYDLCQNKYFKEGNLSKAASMFEDNCLRPYPPLLYWWFAQNFHDPHAWYEARNRFTMSSAAWSAVGHVIGLGDRHSENILVETKTGECVHVDFDCIFDKGLNLPKPEVVPFRLTSNMIDAFGPTGADGMYTSGLETAMRTLRGNRDTLLSVLEPFLKDPVIDWKRHRGQQRGTTAMTAQDRQTMEAKRSIKVIDERLRGIYNLRNPNLTKYRRTDRYVDTDEVADLVPLSVEGQVTRMIEEATSHENLVQLYVGWMPWV